MYKYYAHSFDYTKEKEKNNHQMAILLKREKLTNKLSIIVSFICVIWSIIKIFKGIDLRAEYFLGIFVIAVGLFIYSLHLENLTRKYIKFGIIIEMNKNTNKKIKDIIIEAAKQEHIPITFPLKPDISVSGNLVNSFVAYNVEAKIKIDNYVFFIKMYDELLDKAEVKISKNIEVNVKKNNL
ncbi:DUF2721 domain-containing protein (plasmid) [Lactobacillus sp. PV037]|uniref:hypothetical protein n=1 Tax=Lactobacillus sp. PV037 TaxID=2594496 RepID=UPI00224050C5|nr:hypothetical protein [Lactobacillus sp. PV037]QNQ82972.1 DUF2721 domain-containing protein [Lactobacillus sp. PV037]